VIVIGVEVFRLRAMLEIVRNCRLAFGFRGLWWWWPDGGAALQLVLEVFRAKDGHLDEKEFPSDRVRVGVIQDGPHGYLPMKRENGVTG